MKKKIGNSDYYVAPGGIVVSPRGKELKAFDDSHGYNCVHIYVNKKRLVKKIHRLVAEYYIPNPNKFNVVNHIDGNKKNNNLDNLEWCTHSHNSLHAYRTGLKVAYWTGKKGSSHPRAREVVKMKNNQILCVYESTIAAAKENGLIQQNISNVCRGKRNTCGGYEWKYNEL